jgi:hypothetical protein
MSRSKVERIRNKMTRSGNSERRENKKGYLVGSKWVNKGEYCCFAKVYSCFRARGV